MDLFFPNPAVSAAWRVKFFAASLHTCGIGQLGGNNKLYMTVKIYYRRNCQDKLKW